MEDSVGVDCHYVLFGFGAGEDGMQVLLEGSCVQRLAVQPDEVRASRVPLTFRSASSDKEPNVEGCKNKTKT